MIVLGISIRGDCMNSKHYDVMRSDTKYKIIQAQYNLGIIHAKQKILSHTINGLVFFLGFGMLVIVVVNF